MSKPFGCPPILAAVLGLLANLPAQDEGLTRAAAEALVPDLWATYRAEQQKAGADTLPPIESDVAKAMQPSVLKVGAFEFPYVLLVKGDKPANGWPLYLCLHGGGGNGEAKGPHAWQVNDGEWEAQKKLWARLYPSPGLYFIPRMADDRRGRWWQDHNQVAFDEVIRKAILFRDVDANRVYLMGISEGGYGAIRFAGNRPDRFAATGGMAAAEPLATSPPENMRNVGLRIDIGEQDTMYDRVGLARRMGERLAELKAADAAGYDFAVHVQPGRGHGIDYSLTPKWLSERVRNPRPARVTWLVQRFDSQVALRQYWLALEAAPAVMPLFVDAAIAGNRLEIHAEVREAGAKLDGVLVVRLDDRLADLDRPIAIVVNGEERAAQTVVRSREVMERTLAERGDANACFCAELRVALH